MADKARNGLGIDKDNAFILEQFDIYINKFKQVKSLHNVGAYFFICFYGISRIQIL